MTHRLKLTLSTTQIHAVQTMLAMEKAWTMTNDVPGAYADAVARLGAEFVEYLPDSPALYRFDIEVEMDLHVDDFGVLEALLIGGSEVLSLAEVLDQFRKNRPVEVGR